MNFFSKGQQKNEMFVHKKKETLRSIDQTTYEIRLWSGPYDSAGFTVLYKCTSRVISKKKSKLYDGVIT